jgi:flavodoxin
MRIEILLLCDDMKYTIVYWSRYGHNKKIVNYLSEKLRKKNGEIQILTTDEANPADLPKADLYIFSAAAEAFNLQRNMRAFMKNLEGMSGQKYGIINTHGMDKDRLYKMERLLSKKNMIKIASVDFKVGKDIKSGNALTEGWEEKIDEFAEKI